MSREPLNVGSRKYLLLDDALTERKSGFTLTMNPAVRCEGPVIAPDKPWEIGAICGDSNASVVDDGGVYKLWYGIEYIEAERAAKAVGKVDPGLARRLDAKTLADLRGAERKLALCYATSTDGLRWEKPDAGVIEHQGSEKNNMVLSARLGATVFLDPTAPPDKRYKIIYGGGPRLPHVHLMENVPVQNIYHAIYGATSPDGIHWKSFPEPIIPWYTDTTNVAYWDDRIGKYVAFVRSNEGMIYRDGKTVTPDVGSRLRYRAIGRTESADFRRFPEPTRIMEPTPEERQPYKTGLDYYNSSATKYPFAADCYFLFSSNFYHEPDTLDVHLCTSRDGVHYTRWQGAPFLGLGQADAFDSKCVYMAAGMIRRDAELLMYYVGYDVAHGRGFSRKPYSGGIGVARVRLDGFVSQDAAWSGGELLTVPLTFHGSRLQVNMDANAGGRLKVELLDAQNGPIPNFALQDADTLWCNDIAKTATWRGQSDVSSLKGKPVRLRFVGQGVKLYAFQFV